MEVECAGGDSLSARTCDSVIKKRKGQNRKSQKGCKINQLLVINYTMRACACTHVALSNRARSHCRTRPCTDSDTCRGCAGSYRACECKTCKAEHGASYQSSKHTTAESALGQKALVSRKIAISLMCQVMKALNEMSFAWRAREPRARAARRAPRAALSASSLGGFVARE